MLEKSIHGIHMALPARVLDSKVVASFYQAKLIPREYLGVISG
jgi:hypothetical protein